MTTRWPGSTILAIPPAHRFTRFEAWRYVSDRPPPLSSTRRRLPLTFARRSRIVPRVWSRFTRRMARSSGLNSTAPMFTDTRRNPPVRRPDGVGWSDLLEGRPAEEEDLLADVG